MVLCETKSHHMQRVGSVSQNSAKLELEVSRAHNRIKLQQRLRRGKVEVNNILKRNTQACR